MPTYQYKARNAKGKLFESSITAQNERELRQQLDSQQLFLIDFSLQKSKESSLLSKLGIRKPRVGLKELSIFTWQLYTLLNSGVILSEALATIRNCVKNKAFKNVIEDIHNNVVKGIPFSDALRPHTSIFPNIFIQMVHAGEVGGKLDEMLQRLAFYLERQAEIRAKIKSAMTYPVILLIASVGVVAFLTLIILPRFVTMFDDMGMQLPLVTRIMLSISTGVRQYFILVVAGVIGIAFLFKSYISKPIGRHQFDYLKLKLPVFGPLEEKAVIASFSETLSILLGAGISIIMALETTKQTISNSVIAKSLVTVMDNVSKGSDMSGLLDKTKLFPELVVNMVRVGENTGQLDTMLIKVAEFYKRELNEAIETFTKMIEPVFLVLMAAVVGFIAISIFMPLTEMMEGV